MSGFVSKSEGSILFSSSTMNVDPKKISSPCGNCGHWEEGGLITSDSGYLVSSTCARLGVLFFFIYKIEN